MNRLLISVVDTCEKMKQLRPEWNDLLKSSNANTIFLTFEWLSAWVEVFLLNKRKLFILALTDNEKLVGIAPFYIDSIKYGIFNLNEIHFIGFPDAGTDYLDVIIEKGKEKLVADKIYEYLSNTYKVKWDVLRLYNIQSNSIFLLYLVNRIEEAGKFYEISKGPFCPRLLLPGSGSDFYSGLSKGRRKKLKRDIRVVFRDNNTAHRLSSGISTISYLDDFFRLYHESTCWQGDKIKLLLEKFIDKCGGGTPIQIDMLTVNNQDVAGLLHLKYENSISLLLMAVNKSYNPKISIGNALVGLCIKNSIDENFSYYDFLKGDEPYKFHWTSDGISCVMLSFWKKRPSVLLIVLYQFVKSTLKLILR